MTKIGGMSRAWWLIPSAVLTLGCPAPTPVVDAGLDAGRELFALEVCSRIAAAKCELKLRCYPAFSRLSRGECVDQTQAACLAEYEPMAASFEAKRISFDAAQLSSCERRLTSSACPPSFPPDYPLAVAQPFDDCGLQTGLVTGSLGSNDTCVHLVECAAGTLCVKGTTSCQGTCITLSQLDEPCGIGCAPGLRCDGTRCTYLKTLDETCTTSVECEPDLICLGSCRPRRKLGERCRVDLDRLSPCEPGLACDVVPFVDGLEGTCIVPRGESADCKFHWSCRAGLVCADLSWVGFPASAPAAGSCRAPDGEQFSCPQTAYAAFVGDQCAAGLTCRDTTNQCSTLPERGQSCTPSKQNCSGFQVSCKPSGSGDVGVCTGPASEGETCAVRIDASRTVAIPCASGFCEKEVTLRCRAPYLRLNSICKEDGECLDGRCVPQADMKLRCAPPC
ncbi:MAG: hypothetical protein Q8K32_11705 [Archangium sp.]|nr:hypothetical protein [Archangium sp.]